MWFILQIQGFSGYKEQGHIPSGSDTAAAAKSLQYVRLCATP